MGSKIIKNSSQSISMMYWNSKVYIFWSLGQRKDKTPGIFSNSFKILDFLIFLKKRILCMLFDKLGNACILGIIDHFQQQEVKYRKNGNYLQRILLHGLEIQQKYITNSLQHARIVLGPLIKMTQIHSKVARYQKTLHIRSQNL